MWDLKETQEYKLAKEREKKNTSTSSKTCVPEQGM